MAGDTNGKTDVFVRTVSGANPSTELVSVSGAGSAPGDDASGGDPGGVPTCPEVSVNGLGTQVAFSSDATDLVDDDTNGKTDVFWRDLTADKTELLSVKHGSSAQGDGDSFSPSISGDGKVIAFASDASNLTSLSDDNDITDVFLRDRTNSMSPWTDLLSRCSTTVGNGQSFAPRITSDTSPGTDGRGQLRLGRRQPPRRLRRRLGAAEKNNVADVYFRPLSGSPTVNERVSRDTAGGEFYRPSLEAAVSVTGDSWPSPPAAPTSSDATGACRRARPPG